MRKMHENVRINLEKKNKAMAKRVNKGRKWLVLDLADWVWVNLRKDRFPTQRK